MKLQIFSDLHLEFGLLDPLKSDADIVIAAGDISIQTEGVDWLKTIDKPVIYVAGNHEFWGGDIKSTHEAIKKECEGTNIHYLENETVEIDGVLFSGCTLWTNLGQSIDITTKLYSMMNDFIYIANGENQLQPWDIQELNVKSTAWLESELQKEPEKKRVVVTHHAPSYNSWAEEKEPLLRYAYCNDMTNLLSISDVELWVHGHVHTLLDYDESGTRIVCNPRGYYNYKEVQEFILEKTIEI